MIMSLFGTTIIRIHTSSSCIRGLKQTNKLPQEKRVSVKIKQANSTLFALYGYNKAIGICYKPLVAGKVMEIL